MITALVIIFVIGYLFIALEHSTKIDKAAAALLTGVLCWTIHALNAHSDPNGHGLNEALTHHVGEIASILFFLLGAMTVVELMDAHRAFELVSGAIKTNRKRVYIIQIALISFFLSSVLDNLTTAIIMTTLVSKMIPDRNFRLTLVGIIVVAANAGGAWSPIGDVTTTMLWVGGQISTVTVISHVILPSIVALLVPIIWSMRSNKGVFEGVLIEKRQVDDGVSLGEQRFMLFAGLGVLLFVPVFKTLTHLPPFMGVMLGLSFLWIATTFVNRKKDNETAKDHSVYAALERIDTPTILFFLGILLAVAALQESGILIQTAQWLDAQLGSQTIVVILIGLLSAIVDNVPLVAAAQKMYPLSQYGLDHYFWLFLAYSAGTGGSILIIGSAAGVAAMGIEKISFIDYLKRCSLPALLGFLAGAATYIALSA